MSAKLYGREHDVAILCNAFERVLAGEMAFTLVNGYSGVGKSSLVQELYRPLAVARGRYVTGKYDQYQRSVPYSAIGQALNSFCDQLLCESPEVVQTWRQRILNVVGRNGGALIEVIPRLENVIGPQPPLPEREPQAAQNLLKQLCQDFVQEICRPEEPLVLFLDDLQWADIASLSLLKTVLTNPRLRGLHLVGAYRDNEVESSHPLVLMLDELAKAGRSFATIHLDNLSYASVAAFDFRYAFLDRGRGFGTRSHHLLENAWQRLFHDRIPQSSLRRRPAPVRFRASQMEVGRRSASTPGRSPTTW